MAFWWPGKGLDHSRDMLAAEIGFLQADFGRSLVSSDPAQFTKNVADRTYYVLFEFTRITDFIEWIRRARRPVSPACGHGFVCRVSSRSRVRACRDAGDAGLLGPAGVLALAMPVFVMFTLVAHRRRPGEAGSAPVGRGRESSFCLPLGQAVGLTTARSYLGESHLALPFSLHPSFVVLPFATLFALSVAVTASTFKSICS